MGGATKRKLEARQLLEQPDSVLSADVLSLVRRFIDGDGTPEEVVELLSDNFRGFVQMSNLLGEWLLLLGHSSEEAEQLVADQLIESIVARFNPQRADAIFKAAAGPPAWLEEMIRDPRWRGLLYTLSGQHTNCLLLNYAIQCISEAGHQHEIASSNAVASDLAVYGGVLQTELLRIQAVSANLFCAELASFVRIASESQPGYLLAQMILQQGRQHLGSACLARISQDLEQHAVATRSPAARRTAWQLAGLQASPELFGTLTHLMNPNAEVSIADVLKLHRIYARENPPAVSWIQHQDLFQALLARLFVSSSAPAQQHRHKIEFLIAYASCMNESSTGPPTGTIERSCSALEQACSACMSNPVGDESKHLVPTLRPLVVEFPVVAMGVLQWIRQQMLIPDSSRTKCMVCLSLVRAMTKNHPLQRPAILAALRDFLDQQPAVPTEDRSVKSEQRQMEVSVVTHWKFQILDAMLQLLVHGYVLPVLTTLTEWARTGGADATLHRYAIGKIFDVAQPPYSAEFAVALVQLVRVKSRGLTETLKPQVKMLIDDCQRIKPQLSEAIQGEIKELQDLLNQ